MLRKLQLFQDQVHLNSNEQIKIPIAYKYICFNTSSLHQHIQNISFVLQNKLTTI
jgi:hypothetical protein